VCVCVYVCVREVCVCVCVYEGDRSVRVCTRWSGATVTCVCVDACMYVCMCVYVYMYACVYVYVRVCVCIPVYTETMTETVGVGALTDPNLDQRLTNSYLVLTPICMMYDVCMYVCVRMTENVREN